MKFSHLLKFTHSTVAALAGVVVVGCSSSNSNSGTASSAAAKPETRAAAKTSSATADQPIAKSTFTIDQNSRDPFFPKAKRTVAVAETNTKQAETAVDVPALLQSGFQGVVGNKETRIALVNNVMLEPGRQTVIPILAGGQTRSIPVRCREVLKDAVILEVQGYPEPLRLVRPAYN